MLHGNLFDSSQGGARRKLIQSDTLRILLTIAIIVLAASFRWLPICGLMALTVVLLLAFSGISFKYVLARALFIVPFGLGAVILLPLAVPEHGAAQAFLLLVKLVTANLGMTFILATTPIQDLLKTMKKLRMPDVLVEMIGFTLRYVFVLAEEAEAMLIAQRSRGLMMRHFFSWRMHIRLGQLLGVLLIRSLERSTRIHQAMLSRGYGNLKNQTERSELDERNRNRESMLSVPGLH